MKKLFGGPYRIKIRLALRQHVEELKGGGVQPGLRRAHTGGAKRRLKCDSEIIKLPTASFLYYVHPLINVDAAIPQPGKRASAQKTISPASERTTKRMLSGARARKRPQKFKKSVSEFTRNRPRSPINPLMAARMPARGINRRYVKKH